MSPGKSIFFSRSLQPGTTRCPVGRFGWLVWPANDTFISQFPDTTTLCMCVSVCQGGSLRCSRNAYSAFWASCHLSNQRDDDFCYFVISTPGLFSIISGFRSWFLAAGCFFLPQALLLGWGLCFACLCMPGAALLHFHFTSSTHLSLPACHLPPPTRYTCWLLLTFGGAVSRFSPPGNVFHSEKRKQEREPRETAWRRIVRVGHVGCERRRRRRPQKFPS